MYVTNAGAYSYLLGIYLGDGCLTEYPRTFALRISLDSAYDRIVSDVIDAICVVGGRVKVGQYRPPGSRALALTSYWNGWSPLFPQHGPGRKHERPIVLEPWQREIVEEHPWPFLRGLLHSDGCRSINRVKTTLPSGRRAVYEYPRWYFVNASEDVLGLFRWACSLVEVRCTRSRKRMITVSRRASVALIDEHVGIKC